MLRTPLHEVQQEVGATFAPFGEWELPADFGSVEKEYRAVRVGAGVFGRCARARLVVTGSDRYTWLQGMVTNDVRRLESGEPIIQACMLNATGHLLADMSIVNRPDSLL